MGNDQELLGFLHDEEGSGVSIAILGSLNSLQKLQSKTIFPISFIGSLSSRPERDRKMVDRGVTTRDRVRERALVRSSKDVDVRFLKSIMSLRDRLKSSYSCNQRQCPVIQERLEQHQRCRHPLTQSPDHDPGAQKSSFRGRNMASSPVPSKCVTIGCGPGKKNCTTRAFNTKTGKYEDVKTTIELYDDDNVDKCDVLSKKYAEVDTTTNDGDENALNSDRLTSTTNLSNTPIKAIDCDDAIYGNDGVNNLKSKDYSDGYTTTHAADYRTFSDSQYENFYDNPSTSAGTKSPDNDKIDRETSATSISSRFDKTDSNTNDRRASRAFNRFGRTQATKTNDGRELYTFDPFGRPVRTSTGAYDGKIPYTFDPFGKSGKGPTPVDTNVKLETTSTGTYDDREASASDRFGNPDRIPSGGYNGKKTNAFDTYIKPETTSTGTYEEGERNACNGVGNPERIPTRAYSGKGPITFDTYIKPETTSTGTCEEIFDNNTYNNASERFSNSVKAPNSTNNGNTSNFDRFGNTQRIPDITNDLNETNFDRSKSTSTVTCDEKGQNTQHDRFGTATSAYDERGPNEDSCCKPEAKPKPNINRRTKLEKLEAQAESKRNDHIVPYEKEVREWIQELPMYPSLGKQAKEDNTNTINNLINNLNYLAPRAADPDYEERVKIETYKCLRKMPIWYPGDKRDQDEFENTLIDKLFEQIIKKKSKIVDATNTDATPSKTVSNATVTTVAQQNSNTFSNKSVSNSTVASNAVVQQSSNATYTKTDSKVTSKPATRQNSKTNSNRRASNGKVPNDEIRNAIKAWLVSVNPRRSKDGNGTTNYMPQIAEFINERLRPLLNNPVRTKNRKLIIKSALLKILGELPTNINCPKSRILYLQNFAEDLANRIYIIQAKYVKQNNTNVSTALTYRFAYSDYAQRESMIWCAVRKLFEDGNIDCHNTVIEDVGYILMEFIEMPDPEGEMDARNALIHLLVTSMKLSEAQAAITANMLIRSVQNVMSEGTLCLNLHNSKCLQRNTMSVYSSAEEVSPRFLTSTPKRKSEKKTIPKFNSQEIQYMEKVVTAIRVWIETLPETFSAPDEQNFKETIIRDLAGDITDQVKLEQLAPSTRETQLKFLNYIVCRWLHRIKDFDLQQLKPQIQDILNKVLVIPVPVLTQPQHGNRQAMANIIHNQEGRWEDSFLPKGIDILQDEISIWMNEQPSHIFAEYVPSSRHKKIQELAQVLENKLSIKGPHAEVLTKVKQWLNNMVKPEEKGEIDELTASLKDRVIRLPQDAKLIANHEQKIKDYEEYKQQCLRTEANPSRNTKKRSRNDSVDQENTMQIFISKYLDHNYDIDDSLARRAFNRLLVINLQRLDQSRRKGVYDNIDNGTSNDGFQPEKFISELEYIKYVSDWLKNLPLEPAFNIPGNHERIDVVNSLAISIREVEEERYNNPNAMDYDLYIGSIILQSLRELPILIEYRDHQHVNIMIDQLVGKITANRQTVANLVKANESLHTTGVNIENIGDFIEEFIFINGDDIAHDEVKLEAWAIRLIREIKQIIRNAKSPSNDVIPKTQAYNELLGVPIPGDESAKLFSLELEYVTEISNWLKNLPLLPINEYEEDNRVGIICELAEKMIEIERKSSINPTDTRAKVDFEKYAAIWISDLPLDNKQEIDVPILIQQLTHRMDRVKQKSALALDVSQSNKSIGRTPKNERNHLTKSRNESKEAPDESSAMMDEIEKWSNALPLKSDSEEARASIRNDVSKKLSHKVGLLNMDLNVFNNDIVYKDTLEDEIDTLLENIPETVDLENDTKMKLKTNIVNAIMDARNYMKKRTAAKIPYSQISESMQGKDNTNMELLEDSGFENEEDEAVEERICPIQRLRRYNGIPYCIVPMRYICKKCDGYKCFCVKCPCLGTSNLRPI